jgi:hypothetical protein
MITASTATLARAVLSAVPDRNSDLAPFREELAQHNKSVSKYVQQFAFDQYYNWGLQLTDNIPPEANYFLAAYKPGYITEFQRRLAALDVTGLHKFVTEYCWDRYYSTPTSLSVFGGYLYGMTKQVTDLDLLVILEKGAVIEKNISAECSNLSALVNHRRRPNRRLGLTIISRQQIHSAAENNSVLRSAVIAGTTAIRLWGEPFQTSPIPIAVLLYHAVELMTWGFKAYFEEDATAHRRGVWRVVEAAYILDYITKFVGGVTAGFPPALYSLKPQLEMLSQSGECRLEHFLSSVEALRPRISAFKEVIRTMALQMLGTE